MFAQRGEATISGFVYDATTRETLIGANVFIKNVNRGSNTNVSGYFVIPQLETGNYEIKASYVGYKSAARNISLRDGENKRLDILLDPQDILAREVVITRILQEQ